MTNDRLIESKPSVTAKIVCYMRALAYHEVGAPIAKDNLADLFLSPKLRAQVQDATGRQALFNLPDFQPANYSYLSARTRHLDRLFAAALSDGTQQIVLLGAGYDSRAYRFLDVPDGLRVFEVDAPTTQGAKRKYLGYADITPPQHLSYVPINFNYEKLEDVLPAAGYDAAKRTLFIWEGVTYYISAEAVASTLAFIKNNAASGSTVAFDYIYEPMARQDFRYHGAQAAYEVVAAAGEPFIYGIAEGQIEPFLAQHGFALAEHYTPAEFATAYLDERFEQIYGFMVNAVGISAE